MGLFDKKYCDVCGEKIGLLGNRKLEDGNLCKSCAKKLSPWFNERRHSTVDEIKAQLAYREENRQRVSQFRVSRVIGDYWRVLFDENHRWFTVTQASSPNEGENPDILDYSSITGCRFDIDENRNEIYRQNSEGKNESYNPPRYKYSYNFKLVINVSNPYFNEMEFNLNCGTVNYEPRQTVQVSLFGRSITDSGVNPEDCPEYRKYRDMGQEICGEIDRARGMKQTGTASAAPTAPISNNQGWHCPNCGADSVGKFCENCGSPKPASGASSCTGCGWSPSAGQSMPRFCPECGKQIF